MEEEAKFAGSLPAIQSAIKFGDGMMRVQFDLPQTELQEAKKLLDMANKELEIVVRVKEQV